MVYVTNASIRTYCSFSPGHQSFVVFFSQETKVESNSKPEGWEKPDVRVISCGLDSEMTDAVEIDEKLPNLSGIFF